MSVDPYEEDTFCQREGHEMLKNMVFLSRKLKVQKVSISDPHPTSKMCFSFKVFQNALLLKSGFYYLTC